MLEEFKKQVYEANMELPRRGLITYTWGNVSEIERGHEKCRIEQVIGVNFRIVRVVIQFGAEDSR